MRFEEAYSKLRPAQLEAVNSIDGPLLVVAGPGTGKTQLLSARVANILKTTDTLPQNILCLTFTESGAANMRERLSQFIGKSAYDVNISTYHAFGGEIISSYKEYFDDEVLLEPIDNLGKHEIVSGIIKSLSYADKLKQTEHHLKDLIATISEMKRALLTSEDMRAIAKENQSSTEQINSQLKDIFSGVTRLPSSYEKSAPLFQQTLEVLKSVVPKKPASIKYGSLADVARLSLEIALIDAESVGKSTPLTSWSRKWLEKDADNNFVLSGRLANERLKSLANVFDKYEALLKQRGLYDFDDMILKAIRVMENNQDLRYTLQEKYQYIMLDEYQDTNNAQARIVELLTDNPINEGRPNVMAVGDDDQAIYAFQGAQFSNMLDFFRHYRDTKLVNLTENFRSHQDILQSASMVADQISDRLFHSFTGSSKSLKAANKNITKSHIERRDFKSNISENTWIAKNIAAQIKSGVSAHEIAILTPKHSGLESIVPYLQAENIPIHYEKRENILESPDILQILNMCRLVVSVAGDSKLANSLWPAILSSSWYGIPISDIWNISWRVDSNQETSWTKELLSSDNDRLRNIGLFFVAVAMKSKVESCEKILDYLLGNEPIDINESAQTNVTSPVKEYYKNRSHTELINLVSSLTVLRSKLRDHQKTKQDILKVADLLNLVEAYNEAGENMLNTNPYAESENSVQLMTAFKAKGLEFEKVYLLGVNDETWGSSGRSMSNKLTLPENLAPTRHSGKSEDEKLRLFFVALTRAKTDLYLTNHLSGFSGKNTTRLKYLDENIDNDNVVAHSLPEHFRLIKNDDSEQPSIDALMYSWQSNHLNTADPELAALLKPRLETYQLSPTHLNTFCDLIYGGPESFFMNTLLRFPSAPTPSNEYGSTAHETLEWLQHFVTKNDKLPHEKLFIDQFDENLSKRSIAEPEMKLLRDRGHDSMKAFLSQRGQIFSALGKAEVNFKNEGVFVGNAHMAGKIDRIEIDKTNKTITVVDYKTGKSYSSWKADAKLHKYAQQLYCYKILIENSHTYKGYSVIAGRLEFVEPDDNGTCHALELSFKSEELNHIKLLIESMWQHVMKLDFPDTSTFDPSLKGIKDFEAWMIDVKE